MVVIQNLVAVIFWKLVVVLGASVQWHCWVAVLCIQIKQKIKLCSSRSWWWQCWKFFITARYNGTIFCGKKAAIKGGHLEAAKSTTM